MSFHKSITVPEDAIAALKGLRGQKVSDTERVTATSIKFKRLGSGLAKAEISGESQENVLKAEQILRICITHLEASLDPPIVISSKVPGIGDAVADVETFYFEIKNMKAYSSFFFVLFQTFGVNRHNHGWLVSSH